jgi:hypothetical protein
VKEKTIHEARAFNFTYRYIDDVLSITRVRMPNKNGRNFEQQLIYFNIFLISRFQNYFKFCSAQWIRSKYTNTLLNIILKERLWFVITLTTTYSWSVGHSWLLTIINLCISSLLLTDVCLMMKPWIRMILNSTLYFFNIFLISRFQNYFKFCSARWVRSKYTNILLNIILKENTEHLRCCSKFLPFLLGMRTLVFRKGNQLLHH